MVWKIRQPATVNGAGFGGKRCFMQKKEKKEGWNLRISIPAYEALKAYCEKTGYKMSVFVSNLIIEKTKKDGK